MLDVHTVGAGGGSIAWRDAGGALRVGPRSAGAEPGPACYGLGGTQPTVTDANVVLGHIDATAPLAGGVRLNSGYATKAAGQLAAQLGLTLEECARGILRVADAEMVRALRVVTVQRGIDPRDFTLIAFGGAGPLHAARIADELGITAVLCPRASGVLAALGLIAAPARRDAQRSVMLTGEALSSAAIAAVTSELAAQLGGQPAELRTTYEVRYRGQSFELAVTIPDATPARLREAFERSHEQRYGYRDPEQELELVTVRVSAFGPTPMPPRAAAAEPGPALTGPAVLALPESTVLVPAGWRAHAERDGTIRMEHA
jgi:N-methylhydantoinase A